MKHFKTFGLIALVAACFAGWGPQAVATSVVATPLSKIAKGSTMIVDATVLEQTVWRDGATGRIYTSSMLQVHDWLHGDKPQSIVEFRQLGGDLNDVSMWIPGAYRLTPGQRVILLGLEHQGTMISWGIGQGKYVVIEYEGALVTMPNFGGVNFVEVKPDGTLQATEPDRGFKLLGELKAEIRNALRNGVQQ